MLGASSEVLLVARVAEEELVHVREGILFVRHGRPARPQNPIFRRGRICRSRWAVVVGGGSRGGAGQLALNWRGKRSLALRLESEIRLYKGKYTSRLKNGRVFLKESMIISIMHDFYFYLISPHCSSQPLILVLPSSSSRPPREP